MINIPFVVYARVLPDRKYNKRRTYTRSLEKISKFVADDISKYIEENSASFWINNQIQVFSTPQFAQKPATITLSGWDKQDIPNFQPASMVTVDAPYTDSEDDNYFGTPGRTVSGYRGTQYLHPQGQELDPQVINLVSDLKTHLESASEYLNEIMKIQYMGIMFGERGHSF